MKDLPKVFQNNINVDNNNKFYYSKNRNEVEYDSKTIYQKINEIFSAPNYVYKANVKITTRDNVFNKKIIGRNKDYIITMDNNLIPIKDIINIEAEKK